MTENEQNQHQHEVNDQITVKHDHRHSWKRIHHSWIFWVFLLLMFASIAFYIMSVDFAFAPQTKVSSIGK